MESKLRAPDWNQPDFICQINGDILLNKAKYPTNSLKIQKEKYRSNPREPYLNQKWHFSN